MILEFMIQITLNTEGAQFNLMELITLQTKKKNYLRP